MGIYVPFAFTKNISRNLFVIFKREDQNLNHSILCTVSSISICGILYMFKINFTIMSHTWIISNLNILIHVSVTCWNVPHHQIIRVLERVSESHGIFWLFLRIIRVNLLRIIVVRV